jgi:uncharacterized protein YjiS (DUF1127 family)
MSAISSERSISSSTRRRGRLVHWTAHIILDWKRKRMIQMLRSLDDRQLHDMGLTRDQIESAVQARYDSDLARLR